jgi:hypothetical protein
MKSLKGIQGGAVVKSDEVEVMMSGGWASVIRNGQSPALTQRMSRILPLTRTFIVSSKGRKLDAE